MGDSMSSISILGDTSGSVLIQAPAVAGSPTLTLPTTSGTIMATGTSGTVVQMKVATYGTATGATTNTFVATGLTTSFTPKSASNNILITVSGPMWFSGGSSNTYCAVAVFRNGVTTGSTTYGNAIYWSGTGLGGNSVYANDNTVCFQVYDSPATTSAITYTVYVANTGSSGTAWFCDNTYSKAAVMTVTEIAA